MRNVDITFLFVIREGAQSFKEITMEFANSVKIILIERLRDMLIPYYDILPSFVIFAIS